MSEIPKGVEHVESNSIPKNEKTQYIEGLEATATITGKAAEHLYKGLKDIPKDDPESKQTRELLDTYKGKFVGAKNELKKLKGQIDDSQLSAEKLKTITNNEFLKLKTEDRLQYVTENKVNYSDIKEGKINNVTFFFDQDGNGKDDSDLYKLTTAGQVLGNEIGEVVSGGITYSREGLDGEFFNGNNRLVIETGTIVEFTKLRKKEEKQELNLFVTNGLDKYPEYENKLLLRGLLERKIPIKDVYEILKKDLKKANFQGMDILKKAVKIEEVLTNIERIRGRYKLDINTPKFIEYINIFHSKGKVSGLDISTYKEHVIGYEKHKHLIPKVAGEFPNISEENLINLINKENGEWDPRTKARGKDATAYGLGQMVNKTWLIYGEGLDRNNPEHQLIATCSYLDKILERQDCDIKLAMALYNTGEGVMNISDNLFEDYISGNAPIVKLIEGPQTRKNYTIAAVRYYSEGTSLNEATSIVENWKGYKNRKV